MIRYYAYYSCGGYKDLYLGSSSLNTKYTYFLPLLATWQNGFKPEYAEKLKQIEGLPLVEVISKDNSFEFPLQARNLFSHGGYRVIYLTFQNGDTCFCVRDISNDAKDEEERDIPFNILITASGEEDIKLLDKFSIDSLSHIDMLYDLMVPLFSYDPQVNGIKFNLGKLQQAIYDAPQFERELLHQNNQVNFLIIDSVAMASTALNELNLTREQIDYIAFNDGGFFGKLEYKAKSDSVEPLTMSSQLSESTEEELENNKQQDPSVEEMPEEIAQTPHEPVVTHFREIAQEDSPKSESKDDTQTKEEVDLGEQYTKIQNDIKNLSECIKNINMSLDSSKSTISSYLQKVLDRMESLNEYKPNSFPVISESHNNYDSITIPKIHLWIACIALIVGFLLGALIF